MAFFDMIGEKITNTVGGTTAKAKEMSEVQKMNSNIAALKKTVEEKYAAMGKYYYDTFKNNGDIAELNAISEELEVLLKEIDENEVKVAEKKGLKRCEHCGEFIDNSNTFCPLCGGKQSVVVIKCVNCRTVLEDGARFCPKCGAKQPEVAVPSAEQAATPVVLPDAVSVETVEEPVEAAPITVEEIPEPAAEDIPEPVVEEIPEPLVEAAEPEVEAVIAEEEAVEAAEEVAEIVEETKVEIEEKTECIEDKPAEPEIESTEGIVPEFVPAGDIQPIENISLKCPSCGAELDDDSAFCTECGAKIAAADASSEIVCHNCGNKEEAGTSFCSECGTKL